MLIIHHWVSDATTPLEQLRQILQIQPVLPGAAHHTRYDIPPHHPHDGQHPDLLVESSSSNGLHNMKGLRDSLPPAAKDNVSLLD